MCFSAKWFSDPDASMIFKSEQGGKRKRKAMLEAVWQLLDETDMVVHYNGRRFDIPMLNRDFIKMGLGPPAPYQQVDLLLVVRSCFRFPSNKLAHIIKELDIGEKLKHDGSGIWRRCMKGEAKAWRIMEKYNRHDVDQTEKLYWRLLPWIHNHPNHGLFQHKLEHIVCTNCGSGNLRSKGWTYTKTQKYRRFKCKDCGTPNRGRHTEFNPAESKNILTQA